MLTLGQRQWDAITEKLTELGPVLDEYERGYDQFHQGESYIYFYFLCLADPTDERNRERAKRFAGLYLNENADALNYDPERKLIRAPHNGSGARAGAIATARSQVTVGAPACGRTASLTQTLRVCGNTMT